MKVPVKVPKKMGYAHQENAYCGKCRIHVWKMPEKVPLKVPVKVPRKMLEKMPEKVP